MLVPRDQRADDAHRKTVQLPAVGERVEARAAVLQHELDRTALVGEADGPGDVDTLPLRRKEPVDEQLLERELGSRRSCARAESGGARTSRRPR